MSVREKWRAAVVGLGNVGWGALDAIDTAPDMELVGVVVREHAVARVQKLLPPHLVVTTNINDLKPVDVAIVAVPSRSVAVVAKPILAQGICTVDSFDIHGRDLWRLRQQLDVAARNAGVVAISAAGWDPGTDSLLRAIFALQAPRGITYTNFGPGMSMGHTVAAKKIAGVRNAMALTLPLGYGRHQRLVYIELVPGYDFTTVEAAIKKDPYFSQDDTRVEVVDDVGQLLDTGHGVMLERRGTAGKTANQVFRYTSRITNPALTGQILVAAARATQRLSAGAYTMLEVPLAHFLPGDLQTIVEEFV